MANRISLLARNSSIDSPNAAKRMERFCAGKRRRRILGRLAAIRPSFANGGTHLGTGNVEIRAITYTKRCRPRKQARRKACARGLPTEIRDERRGQRKRRGKRHNARGIPRHFRITLAKSPRVFAFPRGERRQKLIAYLRGQQ